MKNQLPRQPLPHWPCWSALRPRRDPNLARNLAANCANCHGTNSRAVPGAGMEPIAGEPKRQAGQEDQGVPLRRPSGDGDAPDLEGLHRRADRPHRRLPGRTEIRRRPCSIVAISSRRPAPRRCHLFGGCAGGSGKATGHVVVVGGGYGGATALSTCACGATAASR